MEPSVAQTKPNLLFFCGGFPGILVGFRFLSAAAQQGSMVFHVEVLCCLCKAPSILAGFYLSESADEMLGVMSKEDALAKADELELDLVLISENSVPPVAKIVDAGKLAYQMERKKKENIKKTNTKDLKEVKLSYNIGEHDYSVRYRSAEKFIKAGHRVKATIQFRGREQQHVDIGQVLLDKMAKEMVEFASADRPKREGNRLSMFLKPKTEK